MQPQACLLVLKTTKWGWLPAWPCKSVELLLGPVEDQDLCPSLI